MEKGPPVSWDRHQRSVMSRKPWEEGALRRKEPSAVWICCRGVEKDQAWKWTIPLALSGSDGGQGVARGGAGRTVPAGSEGAVSGALKGEQKAGWRQGANLESGGLGSEGVRVLVGLERSGEVAAGPRGAGGCGAQSTGGGSSFDGMCRTRGMDTRKWAEGPGLTRRPDCTLAEFLTCLSFFTVNKGQLYLPRPAPCARTARV